MASPTQPQPQLDPQYLPKTSDGWIKMVRPDGSRAAVDPAQWQAKMSQGYRLPSAEELGPPQAAGAGNGSDIPTPIASVRTSNGLPLRVAGNDSQGRPTLAMTPSGGPDVPQTMPSPSAMRPRPISGPPLATNSITGAPHDSGALLERLLPEGRAKDVLRGMAKSGGQLAVGTADLLHHIIPSKALEATPEERASTVPSNTTERVAKTGTDIAMALAPGGAATRITKAASMAPAASTALRIALNAGLSGGWNKLEGGNFGTGALLGGGGEAAASGMAAAAPRLMRSIIPGIDNPTAQTLLKNTSGVTPASIAASADRAAPIAVSQLENMVGHAGNAPVSTQPALKVVNDAIKKAVEGNDLTTRDNLRIVRDKLLNTAVPGRSARPSEALHIINTLDDLSTSLPSNAKTSYGPAQIAGNARDAFQSELETTAPGSLQAHDTIRQLIQGGKAAKDAVKSNPNWLTNLARHKVLDLVAGGGAYAYTHSPVAGLATAAASHIMTSPVTRGVAARVTNSYLTPQMMNAIKAMLMTASQPGQTPPGQPNMMPPQ